MWEPVPDEETREYIPSEKGENPALRAWEALPRYGTRTKEIEADLKLGCLCIAQSRLRQVSTIRRSKSRDVWQRVQYTPRYSIWMCVHIPSKRSYRESADIRYLRDSRIPMGSLPRQSRDPTHIQTVLSYPDSGIISSSPSFPPLHAALRR